MPEGSSSAAPVINPGPRTEKKRRTIFFRSGFFFSLIFSALARPKPLRLGKPLGILPSRNSLIAFLFVLSPQVRGVGKDDVAQDSFRVVVREVDSWVYLKIRNDVPGKSDSG